jgi:hypothetical protein
LFSKGYAVSEDGHLLETRVLVQALDGLRVVIHTREHGRRTFTLSRLELTHHLRFWIARC